jgi:hypothetical protein
VSRQVASQADSGDGLRRRSHLTLQLWGGPARTRASAPPPYSGSANGYVVKLSRSLGGNLYAGIIQPGESFCGSAK